MLKSTILIDYSNSKVIFRFRKGFIEVIFFKNGTLLLHISRTIVFFGFCRLNIRCSSGLFLTHFLTLKDFDDLQQVHNYII